MLRLRWALWLNVAVPGAGLIALQRALPGLAVAGSFALFGEVALLGLLILPRTLGGVATVACSLAGLVWAVGQMFLLRRMNELQDVQLRLHASVRIEQAREAVAAAEWRDAGDLLADAAGYDDEQPDLNWLLAKVSTAVQPSDKAVWQWHRLDQVDQRGRYAAEIRETILVLGQQEATDGAGLERS